jgi:hypothetical protein
MSLISRLNPKTGAVDFWSEFTKPNPHRWPILGVSMLMTTALLYFIVQEEVVGPPVAPTVTYITSFKPDRSDDEIIESNKKYQLLKDEREAYFEAREERKKEIYRALARASGMDPRKIEREAAQQLAREDAEAARMRAVALGRVPEDADPEPAPDSSPGAAPDAAPSTATETGQDSAE